MKRVLLGCVLTAILFAVYRLIGYWLGDVLDSYRLARFEDLTLLYAIVPGYWLAASKLIQNRTDRAYRALLPQMAGSGSDFDAIKPGALAVGAVIGFAYGAWDMSASEGPGIEYVVLEWCLRFGNGFVWLCSGMLFVWRATHALRLYRLGQQAEVDALNLTRLRPLGSMATTDVLIIMGVMALTPLQSLSSEFILADYRVAFAAGIAASLLLLIVPQLGIHQQARRSKQMRLQRLQTEIDAADPQAYATMETLLAHRDRLQLAPTWPTDTKGFGRAIFYLVVPPLAWVGAAFVERGIDQLF